jgi:hypothetical protein
MFFRSLKPKAAVAADPATTLTTTVDTISAEQPVPFDYERLLQVLEAFVETQAEIIRDLAKGEEAA